jgi:photosystem II stability/assembly factor-like uncharacterized protein
VSNALSGVSFVDANTGAAVGNLSGEILRTTDGGETWTRQSAPPFFSLAAVHLVDANTGAAVGPDGMILRTTTGGE